MTLQTLSEWLRCPICFAELTPTGQHLALGCEAGHRFDVNKRGYVTLLPPRTRVTGDVDAMLADRAALLATGAYAPIAAAVTRAARRSRPSRVVDVGCGTGYYLRHVLEHLPGSSGLALDLSPAAVRRATTANERVEGLVADAWHPLPVRDERADVVLNVFAPHNSTEFHRILKPGGRAIVVVPRADHLGELREPTGMLGVPDDKARQLRERLAGHFTPDGTDSVRYEVALTPARAQQLVGMGPSAHHRHRPREPGGLPAHATVSVDVLSFRRD
jgi:23S rRNA (guanine745-N1)-methyltransferase